MLAALARRVLLPLGHAAEAGLERIGRRPASPPVLDPYSGYATPTGWILRARVLTHLRRAEPRPGQSRWTNVKQMASLFVTDEVAGVPVTAAGVTGTSDPEGYVDLTVPPQDADGAWAEVALAIEGGDAASCPVRLIGSDAGRVVISDIDDTMMVTGAHSLARNLWTTFTGTAATRAVYPDAVRLMARLSDGDRHPIFYVSSSPWNLHHFLESIFAANDLPRGPKFLRDLGITEHGVGQTHLGHKGAAIDRILAAVPDLPVYLLGDTGQKDARVYLEAARRHPGRVRGVCLREPAPGVSSDDEDLIAELEAEGIAVHHGQSFDGAAGAWGIA